MIYVSYLTAEPIWIKCSPWTDLFYYMSRRKWYFYGTEMNFWGKYRERKFSSIHTLLSKNLHAEKSVRICLNYRNRAHGRMSSPNNVWNQWWLHIYFLSKDVVDTFFFPSIKTEENAYKDDLVTWNYLSPYPDMRNQWWNVVLSRKK